MARAARRHALGTGQRGAVDLRGQVYVAHRGKNPLLSVDGLQAAADGKIRGAAGLDNALIEFNPQGRPAEIWAEPGFFCYPHHLAVDAAGNRVLRLRRSAL